MPKSSGGGGRGGRGPQSTRGALTAATRKLTLAQQVFDAARQRVSATFDGPDAPYMAARQARARAEQALRAARIDRDRLRRALGR